VYRNFVSACPLHLQSAVGWEYQAELSKHESQTDAAKGFGGKYGVQKDRQDEVCIYFCRLLHYMYCQELMSGEATKERVTPVTS